MLEALASSGFQGRWQLGTPMPQMWAFEGEPRFAPALARAEYLARNDGTKQAP